MDRVEVDSTPAEEWILTLNATCNRLMTQYLNLLRAASSTSALEEEEQSIVKTKNTTPTSSSKTSSSSSSSSTNRTHHDPRVGGGHMKSSQDPPPPPLASDVAMGTIQCQLASENICIAASNILSLIRTIRLSLLLMDDDTIEAEEYIQVQHTEQLTQEAIQKSIELEQQYMELRKRQFQ